MPMRMRFEPEDEEAFHARRDELGEQFAGWLNTHDVPGDPDDAGLLMDWKWGYGDGALDHWRIADVDEFLLEWCPRKLSADPQDCAGIPATVAAFVEFLAHTGTLAGGDPPSRIRAHCERSRNRFVEEMGNPANFGMAKSLFAGAGGIGPDRPRTAGELDEVLARMAEQSPEGLGRLHELFDDETDDDAHGPPRIGPVRVPDQDAVHAAAASAPLLRTIRALADYCAEPGRTLTAKGNLRLADARHLVEALSTGDDPTFGGRRKLTSADELPTLSWYVHLAVGSGAVRRHKGKLVAVARFAALDAVAAHDKIFRTAVESGVGIRRVPLLDMIEPAGDLLDECVIVHLVELLHGDAEADELIELARRTVLPPLGGAAMFIDELVVSTVREQLERLVSLGAVQIVDRESSYCEDCDEAHEIGGRVSLTPVGVRQAVLLAREGGIEVAERVDPAEAGPGQILDLVGATDPTEWMADARTWFAAQPDAGAATVALAAAALDGNRESIVAMAGLQALEDLTGDAAVEAVRPHLEGPHDGIVLNWMAEQGAIDPDTVDPTRFLCGLVDVLAAALDAAGAEEVVAMVDAGGRSGPQELVGALWRLDHPRVADVLEAVGSQHSVKAVAKAARKALVQHRSMLADRAAQAR